VVATGDLPILAIMHSADSVGLFDLAEAAAGCCQIVFVIDGPPSMTRPLLRFGPVADITGLSDSAAAARVSDLAPDGITTFTDAHLPRTAALADALILPFHSPEVAAVLVDKYRQRQALHRAGLPGPRFCLVELGDRAFDTLVGDMEFPVVVKPSVGAASREVTMAVDGEQLIEAMAQARVAGFGAMVVEEFLPDSEEAMNADFASFVSVESVMGGGQLRHLAVMSKLPLAPPFRETGHVTPSHLPTAMVKEVLDVVTAAIAGIGIVVGGLHTEVKLTPSGPRIIEVNGRPCGMPEVLSAAGGCSLIEAAMRVALGEAPSDEGLFPCDRVGYRINLQPPMSAHRVGTIEGLEVVGDLPGVLSVKLRRRPGDAVDWRLGTDEQVLNVVGAADSLDEVHAMRRQVAATVSISYD
jgi:biotin carboxylase